MNLTGKSCIFVLCGVASLAVAPVAQASLEDTSFAPDVEVEGSSPTLPISLNTWSEDLPDYGDESVLSISALPQGRLATQPPFIDFGRFWGGAFIGAVKYSSEFKAKTDVAGGLTGRVPVPGLPGNWELWAEAYLGEITRDLPFFYPHRNGTWFGGTIGGDYIFIDGEIFTLRGEAGVSYTYWNGVQSLSNGIGGTFGVDFGFYWIKHYRKATVNLAPQLVLNGSTYYALITLGFQVQF